MIVEWIKRHVIIIGIVILVGVSLFVLNKEKKVLSPDENLAIAFEQQVESTEEREEADELMEESVSTVIVDVKGAIKHPGVYEMSADARVTDVISRAGGFSENANQFEINLAQKVVDEMVIFVPREGEESFVPNSPQAVQNGGESAKININDATIEDFTTLNGIGPKKAQAIVDYREENGSFQTIDDLTNVSGIGEKTLENMRDEIVVK